MILACSWFKNIVLVSVNLGFEKKAMIWPQNRQEDLANTGNDHCSKHSNFAWSIFHFKEGFKTPRFSSLHILEKRFDEKILIMHVINI